MDAKQMEKMVEDVLAELSIEELEAKIAPVDCQKKPNDPQCQPQLLYGIPPQ